ncbi:MAG: FHA domain-containing protein [Deltaproteobacteria bacterium]|nr:FHA domain-containing protein [Deltaproteobacteria bacterium]
MHISNTKHIFTKDDFPFASLDDLIRKVTSEVGDGYIMATSGDTVRFLFMIGKVLYTSGLVEEEEGSVLPVKDFFKWYSSQGRADIGVYGADNKLLLCMLVKMAHPPSQSFTTDVINLEDALKMIEGAKKDVIIATKYESDWGFAIFINGKAVFAFLPNTTDNDDGTPLDRLLLYSYSLPEDNPLSVNIYTETKVIPAPDSSPFPSAGSLMYLGGAIPADAIKDGDVYVEVSEGTESRGFYLLQNELTIGRDDDCNICLEESGVSRNHAAIKVVGESYVLEDNESANGVSVNGEKITKKELSDGDEITIRNYILRFTSPVVELIEEAEPVIEPAEAIEEIEVAEVEAEEIEAIEEVEPQEDLASQTIYAKPFPAAVGGSDAPNAAKSIPPVEVKVALTMENGSVFELASITTIGKDDDCDIKLDGVLAGKRHASIIRGRGMYKLLKKGGLSPVKVNGEKITDHTLRYGDVIEIGNQKMTFNEVVEDDLKMKMEDE